MAKNHWYDLDPEVARERELVRTMRQMPTMKPTYKAQALREMAKRLEMEEQVITLKRKIEELRDQAEANEEFVPRPTIKPLVHLNGTSARDLLEEQRDFLTALNHLDTVIPHPNGRDYYPLQDQEAMANAQRQSQRWGRYVKHMIEQATEIAVDIQDQDAKGRKTLG